jgi:hypothetical protein
VPEPLTLVNVLDDSALLSLEHQLHLAELLGEHSWQVDLQQPKMEFTGERPITCTRFHLLGSAAPGPASWLWAWANPSGFNPEVTGLSTAVRDFGQQHGMPELAEAEVPFAGLPGGPADPIGVAGVLADAAKPISNCWTSYTGDAGGGTRVAFLIEHPSFELPAPEPARIMRVLQQGLAELTITDHRRAVHGYAVRRGLGAQFTPDYAHLALTGPGFTATVDFDHLGRIGNINAQLSAPSA